MRRLLFLCSLLQVGELERRIALESLQKDVDVDAATEVDQATQDRYRTGLPPSSVILSLKECINISFLCFFVVVVFCVCVWNGSV